MAQTKVSMVVPCYNKDQYIGEFFESVLAQKWNNIELILVNDGSTDGTRDIISQWEPKLKKRGYSVHIIDQTNKGVTAAIKSGLERVTGEYFCVPDCDDVLNRKYVSAMAEILDSTADVDRVVCDCDKFSWLKGNEKGLSKGAAVKPFICGFDLASAAILYRTWRSLWLYMMRSNQLPQLLRAFQTDFRQSQEPQSLVALSYTGKTVYLPKDLYFYRTDSASGITMSWRQDINKKIHIIDEFYRIVKKTLKLLPMDDAVRSRLVHIAELGHAYHALQQKARPQKEREDCLAGVCETVSRLAIPLKNEQNNLKVELWPLYERAISNYLIGYNGPYKNNCNMGRGRIIGYGAYGTVAKRLVPLAAETPLKPCVLWDRAQGFSDVFGIPVTRPDISGLEPDDTVLVFISNRGMASEVCGMLAESKTDNILYYYDILDYLADYYYPIQGD